MSSKRGGSSICLNLDFCKYDILYDIAKNNGFSISGEKDDLWDIFWSDLSVSSERVSRLKPFQKINHFPGMLEICRKEALSRNLKKLQVHFPKIYNFFPKSFSLPNQLEAFYYALQLQKAKRKKRGFKTYLIKPNSGAMGRGIFLVQSKNDLACRDLNFSVAQEYLDNPLLLDGYKFDMRIYVLVTSVDPLKVYLHKEGIVRLATEKYKRPDTNNLYNVKMHLTNFAINKDSSKFDDDNALDKGSKRLLSSVLEHLEKIENINARALWQEICDIIVYTVITIQPQLAHTYHLSMGRGCDSENNMCFELLGFDIILDSKYKPWLLEINHSPSFRCYNAIDFHVKRNVLGDVFKILNLDTDKKRDYLKRQRKETKERLYRIGRKSLVDVASYDSPLFAAMQRMETSFNNLEEFSISIGRKNSIKKGGSIIDIGDTGFELLYPCLISGDKNYDMVLRKCLELWPTGCCTCKFCKKTRATEDLNNFTVAPLHEIDKKVAVEELKVTINKPKRVVKLNKIKMSSAKKKKNLTQSEIRSFSLSKRRIIRESLNPKNLNLNFQNNNIIPPLRSTRVKKREEIKDIKPLKLESINMINIPMINFNPLLDNLSSPSSENHGKNTLNISQLAKSKKDKEKISKSKVAESKDVMFIDNSKNHKEKLDLNNVMLIKKANKLKVTPRKKIRQLVIKQYFLPEISIQTKYMELKNSQRIKMENKQTFDTNSDQNRQRPSSYDLARRLYRNVL